MGASCITQVKGRPGTHICNEGYTIIASGPSSYKIKIHYGRGTTYWWHAEPQTYSLPARVKCSNGEFGNCDPAGGLVKECRYEWIYSSGKSLAMDEVPFGEHSISFEPLDAVRAGSVSVPVGPSEWAPIPQLTEIAVILVIILSLINLCYFLRMCVRGRERTVKKYRKVHAIASDTEAEDEML